MTKKPEKNENLPFVPKEYIGELSILFEERGLLKIALKKAQGHVPTATNLIQGVCERNFYRLIKRHNLEHYVRELRICRRLEDVRRRQKWRVIKELSLKS